jgi:hypothetical protein
MTGRTPRLPLTIVAVTTGNRSATTVDTACADAVELARAALLEMTDEQTIGDHIGVEAEQDRVAVHLFAAELAGYRGWRWAVTVMRAPRSKSVTVADTVLLPGPGSLLPPQWVPWTDRLRPGDLGVGDLLPTEEDDPRLEPGWNAAEHMDLGDVDADDNVAVTEEYEVALELDLIRSRVLSPIGMDDAVDRWRSGDHGPDAPMALAAPAHCATCGFRIPLRGSLTNAFGVCANEMSPSDGHIVTLDFGCGAHSEAVVVPTMAERAEPVIDEVAFEPIEDVTPPPTAEESAAELGHG